MNTRKGPSPNAPGSEVSALYKRVTDFEVLPRLLVSIDMKLKGKTDSKKSIIVSPRQSLSRMALAHVDLTFSAEERARINALMN